MSNKIAVITGASRGIGRAITLKYAQMGYDVAICCHHNKERLEIITMPALFFMRLKQNLAQSIF